MLQGLTDGPGQFVTELERGRSGEVVAVPVDEVTIASNLRDVFCDVQAIGDDVDARGNIRAPSILVGAMTVASQ